MANHFTTGHVDAIRPKHPEQRFYLLTPERVTVLEQIRIAASKIHAELVQLALGRAEDHAALIQALDDVQALRNLIARR